MNDPTYPPSRQAIEKQSTIQTGARHGRAVVTEMSQPPDNTRKKQAASTIGTSVAIIALKNSGAQELASRWGGRRNSAARTSQSLTLKQAQNIIGAAQYATAIGLPFNRFVTIHWQQAGIPDSGAARSTGQFIKLASDYCAKRGSRIAWAWVRENGDGKGSHVHILLHWPNVKETADNGANWRNLAQRWLRAITDKPYRVGTIKTERIGGTINTATASPALHNENLAKVVGYILKGTDPSVAPILGLTRLEAGGTIIGKRAATSQNIGQAARTRSLK